MPRFPRIHFEGALYYIRTKADYKLDLFRDDPDRTYYISLISDYKARYNFKLYSLALIADETHLLIEPSSDFTISQIMHDINANYTKYYNKKYERKGHLFKERFKAILIEKESCLLEMTRYIHRIVLKENPLPRLDTYRWSSYPCYTKTPIDANICLNIDCDEVLSLFSQASEARSKLYQEFVEKADRDELSAFSKRLYRTSVVGTKEFVRKIKEMSETVKTAETKKDEIDMETALTSERKMVNRWIAVFAVFILLFLGINSFLLKSNHELKLAIKEASSTKEVQFKQRLATAEENLRKDLEEKYRADMVSYRVMSKKLERLEQRQMETKEL